MILIQSYWQRYKAVHTSDWLVCHFCSVACHDCSHLWRCSKCIPEKHPVLIQHFIVSLWIHWIAVLAIPEVQCLPRTRRPREILFATDSEKHGFGLMHSVLPHNLLHDQWTMPVWLMRSMLAALSLHSLAAVTVKEAFPIEATEFTLYRSTCTSIFFSLIQEYSSAISHCP